MKNFDEFLTENLVGHVKSEPKSKAAHQAKKLGLKYFGFGRYGDHEGKVSYVVQGGWFRGIESRRRGH